MASYSDAKNAAKQHQDKLYRKPNVIGVAVGRKNDDGDASWSVRVLVSRKSKRIKSRNLVPRELAIRCRGKIVCVLTDIVEVAPLATAAASTGPGRHLNVKLGGPTSQGDCACVFRHRQDGRRFGLTAGHVIDGELVVRPYEKHGRLRVDHRYHAVSGDGTKIGHCFRCSSKRRPVDLAFVQLDDHTRAVNNRLVTGLRDDRPQNRERIWVHTGRGVKIETTHFAMITSLMVGYDTQQGRENYKVNDVVSYEMGSLRRGDSGAPVTDQQNQLIGVHIAGGGGAQGSARALGCAVPVSRIRTWVGNRVELL